MAGAEQEENTAGAKQLATDLVTRLAGGDRRALARAISVVEDRAAGWREIVAGCKALGRRGIRIGVTGAPGAGKSTLVDRLIRLLRQQGARVGVVAVDPTSPFTGGALLGDRIRMQGFVGDEGVSIRSMASRGVAGGTGEAAGDVCAVMEAAGFSTVLVETVGVGQDEVSVAGVVDVTVLVLVPGMGDDVQSLKAGIMEIADIFAINKSDMPGADRVEAEITSMQSLGEHAAWVAPVVRTVASTGEGVAHLMEAVERRLAPGKTIRALVEEAPRLDHLGIAVQSIASARGFYELLALPAAVEEIVAHEQVKTLMLAVGESRIELLEALTPESVIGRFLARRGEGLHHVALKVAGINALFARLQAAGVRLASDSIRIGAGGHQYFFVHPASTGGVLIELVSDEVIV